MEKLIETLRLLDTLDDRALVRYLDFQLHSSSPDYHAALHAAFAEGSRLRGSRALRAFSLEARALSPQRPPPRLAEFEKFGDSFALFTAMKHVHAHVRQIGPYADLLKTRMKLAKERRARSAVESGALSLPDGAACARRLRELDESILNMETRYVPELEGAWRSSPMAAHWRALCALLGHSEALCELAWKDAQRSDPDALAPRDGGRESILNMDPNRRNMAPLARLWALHAALLRLEARGGQSGGATGAGFEAGVFAALRARTGAFASLPKGFATVCNVQVAEGRRHVGEIDILLLRADAADAADAADVADAADAAPDRRDEGPGPAGPAASAPAEWQGDGRLRIPPIMLVAHPGQLRPPPSLRALAGEIKYNPFDLVSAVAQLRRNAACLALGGRAKHPASDLANRSNRPDHSNLSSISSYGAQLARLQRDEALFFVLGDGAGEALPCASALRFRIVRVLPQAVAGVARAVATVREVLQESLTLRGFEALLREFPGRILFHEGGGVSRK